jgi:hypothetical protein
MFELITECKALDGAIGQALARSCHCRFGRIGLIYGLKSRAGRRSQCRPECIGVQVSLELAFYR